MGRDMMQFLPCHVSRTLLYTHVSHAFCRADCHMRSETGSFLQAAAQLREGTIVFPGSTARESLRDTSFFAYIDDQKACSHRLQRSGLQGAAPFMKG